MDLKTDFINLAVEEDVVAKSQMAIDYIKSKTPKESINDKLIYLALYYLSKRLDLIQADIFLKNEIEPIFANIFFEIFNIHHELNFKDDSLHTIYSGNVSDQNTTRIGIFSLLLYLSNIFSLRSVKFTKNFSAQKGLEAYFLFLKDDSFIDKVINLRLTDFAKSQVNIIEQILLNVYILSKSSDENIQTWVDLNSVDVLIKIANLPISTQIDAYLSIANIANDKQIESLTGINKVTKMILKNVNRCACDFKNDLFKRFHRQILENDEIVDVYVHCIQEKNGTYSSLLVFLSGLYRMCVNDKLRYDTYFSETFRQDIKDILFKGNDIEIRFCLKLYGQLSFNSLISEDISKDTELVNFIDNLAENKKEEVMLCKQIMWNLKQNQSNENDYFAGPLQPKQDKNGHIMISYNGASRELCLKIKSILESFGYKIWIDVENIHGSSLDSMAKAVENSYCVLLCITEKYRQSVNCQAEAQYAFRLNKPIIPLIFQSGYESVKGWLGIIISDKIFINFTKYEFEECMRRLKSEINCLNIVNRPNIKFAPMINHFTPEIIKLKSNEKFSIENWDQEKVKDWFESNRIDINLVNQFFPCDGSILQQLYEMRRDAPEFYYQALNKNQNIQLKSLVHFTHCLNKIFK